MTGAGSPDAYASSEKSGVGVSGGGLAGLGGAPGAAAGTGDSAANGRSKKLSASPRRKAILQLQDLRFEDGPRNPRHAHGRRQGDEELRRTEGGEFHHVGRQAASDYFRRHVQQVQPVGNGSQPYQEPRPAKRQQEALPPHHQHHHYSRERQIEI